MQYGLCCRDTELFACHETVIQHQSSGRGLFWIFGRLTATGDPQRTIYNNSAILFLRKRFSIGFRFGFWLDHFKTWIRFNLHLFLESTTSGFVSLKSFPPFSRFSSSVFSSVHLTIDNFDFRQKHILPYVCPYIGLYMTCGTQNGTFHDFLSKEEEEEKVWVMYYCPRLWRQFTP